MNAPSILATGLHLFASMTKPRLRHKHFKDIRDLHREAICTGDRMHQAEMELIELLAFIDRDRTFITLGPKSLRGYIESALRFTRPQSQRLATLVRRRRWQIEETPAMPP